jgi:plastocyanin
MNAKSLVTALGSLPLLGVVLFIFSVGYPPFDDATTLDLTTHMVQHLMIVVAGILIAYPLHKRGYLRAIEGKNSAYVGLVVLILLVAFWHIPDFWDAAVLNPLTHAVEHFSFLVVGILIGSTLQTLSDRAKIDVLVLGFFGHFGYGLILISIYRLYPLYSLADQGALGTVMFGVGPFYWVGILYLIFRNKAWFREVPLGEEARRLEPQARSSERPFRRRRLQLIIPISTIVLVAVLIAFYSSSVVAISFAPNSQSASTPQVAIIETPISWQFSPQYIKVVVGVNNTVVWVSHSLSYDTVTGANGTFTSGPIAPGQTFSKTFTAPGTYHYYCVYHPWMVGTVTVVAQGPQKG